jgi:hypothetical protein
MCFGQLFDKIVRFLVTPTAAAGQAATIDNSFNCD